MIKIIGNCLAVLVFVFTATSLCSQPKGSVKDIRTLIVFFDGLRPDYITPEVMPNLYAFSQSASYGKNHHSVFPTVTRVNASSYASGSYPATHGIMGNVVYLPQVDTRKVLNTESYLTLNRIDQATDGRLLTGVSLGEALQKAGATMMVFSSGSTGQAMLQNHTVGKGAIINTEMILPESFRSTVVEAIGPVPASGKPNTLQHKWITDALIHYGMVLDGPLVSAIWFSDPDGAAHAHGIGSPQALEALKVVDSEFGRIVSTLREKSLTKNFNIVVSSDHGFITKVGKESLQNFLIREGLKKDKDSDDVIIAGGALFVKDHDPAMIGKIVARLQAQPWVGPVFTKAQARGEVHGMIQGTLSFDAIHWNHPERSADILVKENWDDSKNDKGYAGTAFSTGVAGHGGISSYEVHIPLLASGPSFKKSFSSDLPTSNVDIVPTILSIYNIPLPSTMTGRVMSEFFEKNGSNKLKARKETITTTADIPGGTYTLTLERTHLGKYKYVDFARVVRTGGR